MRLTENQLRRAIRKAIISELGMGSRVLRMYDYDGYSSGGSTYKSIDDWTKTKSASINDDVKGLKGSVGAIAGGAAQIGVSEYISAHVVSPNTVNMGGTAAVSSGASDVNFSFIDASGNSSSVAVEVKKDNGQVDVKSQPGATANARALSKLAEEDDAFWVITNKSVTKGYVLRRKQTSDLSQTDLDAVMIGIFGQKGKVPTTDTVFYGWLRQSAPKLDTRNREVWATKTFANVKKEGNGFEIDMSMLNQSSLTQQLVSKTAAALKDDGTKGFMNETIDIIVDEINATYSATEVETNPRVPAHTGIFGGITRLDLLTVWQAAYDGHSAGGTYRSADGKWLPVVLGGDKMKGEKRWHLDGIVAAWPNMILNAYEIGRIDNTGPFAKRLQTIPTQVQQGRISTPV